MRWIALVLGVALLGLIAAAVVWPARRVVQMRSATGAPDRCPTCHQSGDHPPVPGHADPSSFGCTACHGGQGRRLDMQAHGPPLGGGPDPFLQPPLMQANCARCHAPTDLPGAEALGRGIDQYLSLGCTGCHEPGRRSAARGPDLRRIGRRSPRELRGAIVDVRVNRGQAVMPSYRLRYPQTPQGRRALDELVTALLALQTDRVPFRDHWHDPLRRVEVDCLQCHRGPAKADTIGRPHRCSLLRTRPSLRCARCHPQSAQTSWTDHRGCPQIRAAGPLCDVCHLR